MHTVLVKQFKPAGQSEFCPEGHHMALVQLLALFRARLQKLRLILDWAVKGARVGVYIKLMSSMVVVVLSPSMAATVTLSPSILLLLLLISVTREWVYKLSGTALCTTKTKICNRHEKFQLVHAVVCLYTWEGTQEWWVCFGGLGCDSVHPGCTPVCLHLQDGNSPKNI